MDQEVYWNSMLHSLVEAQDMPDYLLSPDNADIPYVNMDTQDNADLNVWTSGGPSSAGHSLNEGNHDESEDHELLASQTANASGGVSIEEGRMLSVENVNINLNRTEVSDEQLFSHNFNLADAPQIPEHIASHISMTENSDGRPGSSLDGLRLGCKRKIIEGVAGPSSASGSASFFHPSENNLVHSVSADHNDNANASINISSPSSYLSGPSSSQEQSTSRVSPITGGNAPDYYPPASVVAGSDSSRRSFRPRINPVHQYDIFPSHIFSSRNTARRSSIWTPNESSSQLLFDQRLESRPTPASSSSQSRPYAPAIPGMPPHVHPLPQDATSGYGVGSSSSSINSGERLLALRDANTRGVPGSIVSEQPSFIPTTEMRHLVQDATNRSVTNQSARLVGNTTPSGAGTSSGVNTSAGLTRVPYQDTQLSRSLAEVVHRTLLPSVGSESGGQSDNITLQQSAHSATSQELVSESISPSNQPPVIRSSRLMDVQSDGVPLSVRSLAAREGRSRMLSEIRNALDLVRRGEILRFEDIFMLDPSVFHGVSDLQDRHRDMRLDVDNMSYEELLALEDQIGNVSTGLSEERISKCLKQHKHSSFTVTILAEPEPCCICQEEYMEGEDLGTLDCGHDFHAACIKQWLMCKNLCPICKTTALVT
ncbi:putative E3 ubiquitin-protein ligase HIP1 isoform X1 [Iris pallida]|uniref:RING-type E3 ubiquitin transferase n=1 Tax=Iris pallida TaxID=29817 RepID=A0AAX6F451_IRIPA|nr:putative E3 ubiquitin-protein ligase HIP1 isoform X1 [Iris pallida]KAJ6810983.1 putative E3 ubiquitin-protein ligase HIP1 isoform X1 [Iris pallida]